MGEVGYKAAELLHMAIQVKFIVENVEDISYILIAMTDALLAKGEGISQKFSTNIISMVHTPSSLDS